MPLTCPLDSTLLSGSLFLFEDVFSRGGSWFLGDKLSLLVLLAYVLIDSDFPCSKLRVELHHRAESSGR